MAINLRELRLAVISYVSSDNVPVSISQLIPAVPGTINPNEEFLFSVTVSNATAGAGGIALKNIVYHLTVNDESVAKLIVPGTSIGIARASVSASGPILTPGTLVSEMYLFRPNNSLSTGGSDTIPLNGKAGGAVGTTSIKFHVHADPDLDYLFPKNQTNGNATRTVGVV